MRYFFRQIGNVIDYFNEKVYHRYRKGTGEVDLFATYGWLAMADAYNESKQWKEISEKEAKLLIVRWKMGI